MAKRKFFNFLKCTKLTLENRFNKHILNLNFKDRELDPYMPPWARYHSHGVGVLFGWLLLSERKNQVISKFLRKRRALIRVAIIFATWFVTLGTFWFIVFGLNYCFKVNWVEEGNFLAPIDFNSTEISRSKNIVQTHKNYLALFMKLMHTRTKDN